MQLLCKKSEEGKNELGIIDAEVLNLRNLGCTGKFRTSVLMRYSVTPPREEPFLLEMIDNDYYFVHSFALKKIMAPT